MTARHRQHYFEANAPMQRPATGRAYVYVLNGIAVAMLAVVAAAFITQRQAAATPERASEVTSVEDARIEGFRAGYMAGMGQGCNRPVPLLSYPLAAR